MRPTSNGYLRQSSKTGFTLVEVMTGLALLSTLLVTTLLSYRGHAEQIRAAQSRLDGVDIADSLLRTWTTNNQLPPLGSQETIGDRPGWSWRLVEKSVNRIDQSEPRIIRLEIVEFSRERRTQVWASVDLVASVGRFPIETEQPRVE